METPGTTLTTVMTADNLTGEGGLLIHGRLCLDNFDRGDLFSQELDRKLSSVVCGVCLAPSRYNITTSSHPIVVLTVTSHICPRDSRFDAPPAGT